jgi:hypothetical protein
VERIIPFQSPDGRIGNFYLLYEEYVNIYFGEDVLPAYERSFLSLPAAILIG